MTYESLIFDIDGTLWDSRALVAEGYNIQLRKEGLESLCVDAERLRPLFGKVMTEIADELFPHIPGPERYPLMERCMLTENRYLRRPHPSPPVLWRHGHQQGPDHLNPHEAGKHHLLRLYR